MTTFQHPFFRATASGPWRSLADDFRRELGRTDRVRGAVPQGSRGVFPPVNLLESEDRFVLTAELPGITAENIDISIEGTSVTISGQRKAEAVAGNGTAVHRRERQNGRFRRAFELPLEIDVDAATARHKNGVLTLDLPKSAALKPRQIEVETP